MDFPSLLFMPDHLKNKNKNPKARFLSSTESNIQTICFPKGNINKGRTYRHIHYDQINNLQNNQIVCRGLHHLIQPLLIPYYHLLGLNLQHNKTAVRSFKQSGWKSCVVFLKCENYMYPQTQVPSFCLEHLAYFSFLMV